MWLYIWTKAISGAPTKQNVILTLRNEGEGSSEYTRQQSSFRFLAQQLELKAVKPFFFLTHRKWLIPNRKEFLQVGRVLRDKPIKYK